MSGLERNRGVRPPIETDRWSSADFWVAFWLFIVVCFVFSISSRSLLQPLAPESVLSDDISVLAPRRLAFHLASWTLGVLTLTVARTNHSSIWPTIKA